MVAPLNPHSEEGVEMTTPGHLQLPPQALPPQASGHQDHLPREQTSGESGKYSAPSLDTFNTLAPAGDTHGSQVGLSPSGQRADASRLDDDLELLRIERAVSLSEVNSNAKHRAHHPEPDDAFNQPLPGELHLETSRDTSAALFKFWLFLRKFPRFVRYVLYLIPGAAILLIPVLLGALAFRTSDRAIGGTGGVYIMWFGIWLEIVWGSLWLSRMVTSLLPGAFQGIAKLVGSTTSKKWRIVGAELELHTAVFLWMLAVIISYMPIINGHRVPIPKGKEQEGEQKWIGIVQKVIIALFTLAALNFVEKILIQWIATSFHGRTYATRIDNNKTDIRQLVTLYEYAKAHNEEPDYFWNREKNDSPSGGAQTPMQTLQDNARNALNKVGYVAGRVGNDLIGRKVDKNHPQKVVAELLRNTSSAYTLARMIYRSLVKPDSELVYLKDLRDVYQSEEEADAAFAMFDKDLNGDISLDEFEAVSNEIHLEKKAIAASLKDLDSVIQKLDKVFLFIIFIITIIIFISIISNSAATALGSAGTVVLGLSWLLQATAQEFLQSIIFVFIKHPFDVGDRVTVYGNTGSLMMGDDYYVTEISLLYTEFKKMEGHMVQAPNSLLNTLFILNQRRSNGLADPVKLTMRFGTPPGLIEELKSRMVQFCLDNKRDYKSQIITEMVSFDEVRSCTMNMIFFHKSNFQNELLRLTRHNRFCTELMFQMTELGIQSPFRIEPGGSRDNPMYWAGMPPQGSTSTGKEASHETRDDAPPMSRQYSIRSDGRRDRAASMERGMMDFQDVFENRREVLQANRLASIREKENAMRREDQAEAQVASSTSVDNGRTSQDSRARGFVSRVRSRSRSQQAPGQIV